MTTEIMIQVLTALERKLDVKNWKLFNSFHQSIDVLVDKLLELIAEETEFSANEILKDTRSKKRRQLVPPTANCSKSIGSFLIRK